MKVLSVMIFLIGFLLFRPHDLQENGMMCVGDDQSYFAHAASIAYGQFPSYKKEFFTDGDTQPYHPVGPGLMAVPFVYIFSLVDRAYGNSIVMQRRPDNIPSSWSAFGFMVSSVFYLWLGCFLLYSGLRRHFREFETVLAVFLMVLCQGIPLFAFRRPVFSHISEFCVMSALVALLLMPREEWQAWSRGWRGVILPGSLLGFLSLIRYNNFVMVAPWLYILFFLGRDGAERAGAWKKTLGSLAVAGAWLLCFLVIPDRLQNTMGQQEVLTGRLLNFHVPIFYVQRLWHVLTGLDWGLVYSAPFILIGIGAAFAMKFPLRRAVLVALLPLLVNLYVVFAWKTQGGWYGYRYLFPVAIPLLVYPLAWLLSRAREKFGVWKVALVSLLIAVPPLLSMLAFQATSALQLHPVMQYFGITGWGNNTYQWAVWQSLWQDPSAFLAALGKGGPLYVLVCWRMLMNSPDLIDTILRNIYLAFSPVLMVRVLIIYAIPFLLLCSLSLWQRKDGGLTK